MPKFSIIIPVYNVAPYLRECLDSVLAQTFTDWEAICVDDGSTDGSGAILDEYAAKDSHFRVVHQANAGVSAARNAALDVACGEWVWFVDGDDMIHPGSLWWFVSIIEAADRLDTFAFSTGHESSINPSSWPRLPAIDFPLKNHVVFRNFEVLRAHRRGVCSVILRRDAIKDLRFRPYRVSEDVLFMTTAYWRTTHHVFLPADVYFYRQRAGSAMQSPPNKDKCREMLHAETEMMENIGTYKTKEDDSWLKDYLGWYRNINWYTVGGMLFNLDAESRRMLMPLWYRLNELHFDLCRDNVVRHAIHFVYKMTKNATLCYWLVMLRRRIGLGRILNPFKWEWR